MTEESTLELLKAYERQNGYETNFAVKKFLELPLKAQREISDRVISESVEDNVEAARALIELVLKNSKEMAKFVSSAFDEWLIFPDDIENKAHYLWLYFKTHLKEQPDNIFVINPIS